MSGWSDLASPRVNAGKDGDFTLIEHPEPANRGLAVRPVTPQEKGMGVALGRLSLPTVGDGS
jgi:hypothetical protein